jgi:rubrerythrin
MKVLDDETMEQQALEIAMKEEKSVVEQYSLLAKDMVDPLVKAIFERVVKETQGHYDMIEDDYMHIMGMVDKTDQDIYVRE